MPVLTTETRLSEREAHDIMEYTPTWPRLMAEATLSPWTGTGLNIMGQAEGPQTKCVR